VLALLPIGLARRRQHAGASDAPAAVEDSPQRPLRAPREPNRQQGEHGAPAVHAQTGGTQQAATAIEALQARFLGAGEPPASPAPGPAAERPTIVPRHETPGTGTTGDGPTADRPAQAPAVPTMQSATPAAPVTAPLPAARMTAPLPAAPVAASSPAATPPDQVAAERITAVLNAALDRLGAAHHRPFSRA